MIGKGDIIEIIMGIIGVKGGKSAVFRAHAPDPLGRRLNRLAIALWIGETHRPPDHRGIIQIGIIGIGVLEGPATPG